MPTPEFHLPTANGESFTYSNAALNMNAVKVQKRFSNSCASCHHQFDSVDKYNPTTYTMPSQEAHRNGAYAKNAIKSNPKSSPKNSMPTITNAFGTGSLLLLAVLLLRFDACTFMRWICNTWCGGGNIALVDAD